MTLPTFLGVWSSGKTTASKPVDRRSIRRTPAKLVSPNRMGTGPLPRIERVRVLSPARNVAEVPVRCARAG